MKHVLLAGFVGFGLLGGIALAQQDTPQPLVEADEAETPATELGDSVDALLQDTFQAPEPIVPIAPEVPELTVPQTPSAQNTGPRDLGPRGRSVQEPTSQREDVREATDVEQGAVAGPLNDVTEAAQIEYVPFKNATLRTLDKITGRATDISVSVDTPIVFGSLNIEMKTCYQTPPELPPESAAFLSIRSTQAVRVENMKAGVDASKVSTVSEDNPRLFSGWMFASSPGLSALEHPVYDVWVIRCNAP